MPSVNKDPFSQIRTEIDHGGKSIRGESRSNQKWGNYYDILMLLKSFFFYCPSETSASAIFMLYLRGQYINIDRLLRLYAQREFEFAVGRRNRVMCVYKKHYCCQTGNTAFLFRKHILLQQLHLDLDNSGRNTSPPCFRRGETLGISS